MVNGIRGVGGGGGRPGRELPKEFRGIVSELVDKQGWRYDNGARRGGHPRLYPPDPAQPPLSVPTTAGDRRSLGNFVAQVRRLGGRWRTR